MWVWRLPSVRLPGTQWGDGWCTGVGSLCHAYMQSAKGRCSLGLVLAACRVQCLLNRQVTAAVPSFVLVSAGNCCQTGYTCQHLKLCCCVKPLSRKHQVSVVWGVWPAKLACLCGQQVTSLVCCSSIPCAYARSACLCDICMCCCGRWYGAVHQLVGSARPDRLSGFILWIFVLEQLWKVQSLFTGCSCVGGVQQVGWMTQDHAPVHCVLNQALHAA